MLRKSYKDNQNIFLDSDCELSIINLKGKLSFDKNVKKILISELINSRIDIEVKSDISIIFLHNKGSSISRVNINLLERNAHLLIREVVVTNSKDIFSKEVNLIHNMPLTFSDYKFFGFAVNESSLKISAKSKVFKGMSGSEAHQILRVFTDDKAIAEGQPGLFIDDFDVKASHGNSIGQIDQRTLYYLQTKGINKKLARWMIIKGQMSEALLNLDEESKKRIISDVKSTLKV